MKPRFFKTQDDFRKWLVKNHASKSELFVGYYKKHTGRPSLTWPESVDQALCFGWIDGIRKSLGDESYMIRFTPRRPKSIWSDVNIKRMAELKKLGLLHDAGVAAFARRTDEKSVRYAYEQRDVKLSSVYEKEIRSNSKAWEFFQQLPPSVRKPTIWWVMSAKQNETQLRRLKLLISCSAKGERIPHLISPSKAKKKK